MEVLSKESKHFMPYPMSGPTYLPHIPNLPHYIQNSAHQVLIDIYWPTLLRAFYTKIICFFYKPSNLCT